MVILRLTEAHLRKGAVCAAAHRADGGVSVCWAVPFKLILSLIFAGLAVLFVIQNVTVIEVRFFVWGIQMTLSLLIFLLFASGTMVGWLLHSYWSYRRKSLDGDLRMT